MICRFCMARAEQERVHSGLANVQGPPATGTYQKVTLLIVCRSSSWNTQLAPRSCNTSKDASWAERLFLVELIAPQPTFNHCAQTIPLPWPSEQFSHSKIAVSISSFSSQANLYINLFLKCPYICFGTTSRWAHTDYPLRPASPYLNIGWWKGAYAA